MHSSKVHHLINFLKTDLGEFDIARFLHTIGRSLIGIFIPILLLKNGYSLELVFTYLAIYFIIDFFMSFASSTTAQKIGGKNTMLIGVLFEVIYFYMLYTMNTISTNFLIILALVAAVADSFYWVPLHPIFMQASHKKKRAKEFTYLSLMGKAASITTPLIGALILLFLDKNQLIYVVWLFLFLSLVPLYKMKHTQFKKKHGLTQALEKPIDKDNVLLTIFRSIHNCADDFIWPIFVFLFVKNVLAIGYIGALTSLSWAIFALIIAKYLNKKNTWKFLAASGVFLSINWAIRPFITNEFLLVLSSFVITIFYAMFSIPYHTQFYDRGKQWDPGVYSMIYEGIGMGSRTLVFIPFLILGTIESIFIMPALAGLGITLIALKNKKNTA